MPLFHCIKSAVVTLSILTLAACGGGGDELPSSASPDAVVISSDNAVTSSVDSSVFTSSSESKIVSSNASSLSSSGDTSSSIESINSSRPIVTSSVTTFSSATFELMSSSSAASSFSSNHHATISSSSVIADTAAPHVEIAFPSRLVATEGKDILVRGIASDSNKITSVQINGRTVTTENNFADWQLRVPLVPGENILKISASDSVGNVANDIAEVSVIKSVLLQNPRAFTLDEARNRALVTDATLGVIEVDLITGEKKILSHSDASDNTNRLVDPRGIAIDTAHNRALVVDQSLDSVIAVDLSSGVHTVLSNSYSVTFVAAESIVVDSLHNRALIVDAGNDMIVAVDLTSGVRTHFAQIFEFPVGIALDAKNNRALVVDYISNAVTGVDLESRKFNEISANHLANQGVSFARPVEIVIDSDRNLALITDTVDKAIIAVDLATGARTFLSDKNTKSNIDFIYPLDIAIDKVRNRAIVLDLTHKNLITVDLTTGKRDILYGSEGVRSITPSFWMPESIVIDKTYNRGLIVDSYSKAIVAVDLTSGERSIFSSIDVPNSENNFQYPVDIKLDPKKNRAIALDQGSGSFIGVDLKTGNRTLLSSKVNNPYAFSSGADGFSLDLVNNRAYVAGLSGVASFDLVTGEWKLLSGINTPDNINPIGWPHDIALDMNNNRALIVDNARHSLMAINLESGARTIISDDSTSLVNNMQRYKDQFYNPYGISFDEKNNRALVVDKGIPALISVNLVDGIRTVISENYIPNNTNPLKYPVRLTADYSQGVAFVVTQDSRSILLVDLVTGERVIFAQ